MGEKKASTEVVVMVVLEKAFRHRMKRRTFDVRPYKTNEIMVACGLLFSCGNKKLGLCASLNWLPALWKNVPKFSDSVIS